MRYILALLAALLPFQAAAKNPIPEGEYMLGDPILSAGVQGGMIVPIFVHMTSEGDSLRFSFFSSFRGDKLSCESTGKCQRAVEALSLDVTEVDGHLRITDFTVNVDSPIDRTEMDRPFIIDPTRLFVDGATVSVDDRSHTNVVTLKKPSGRSARFFPASPAFLDGAIEFAKAYELSLAKLDYCVIRQVAEISAAHDRSPAQEDILRIVRLAGRIAALQDRVDIYDTPPDEGTERWRDKTRLMMLRLATNYNFGADEADPVDQLRAVFKLTKMDQRLGDAFETLFEQEILNHADEIIAARAYYAGIAAELEPLDYDAQPARVCRSILVDKQ